MGACATKSGDLKARGEPPLVAEDAVAAPPVAEGEEMKADGVPAAAEADPADVSRRRSISDLLKEDAVKVVIHEESVVATDDEAAGPPASHSSEKAEVGNKAPAYAAVVEQHTAGQPTDGLVARQKRGGNEQPAEEEKRADPDSVQVAVAAAAQSAEKSEVADRTPA